MRCYRGSGPVFSSFSYVFSRPSISRGVRESIRDIPRARSRSFRLVKRRNKRESPSNDVVPFCFASLRAIKKARAERVPASKACSRSGPRDSGRTFNSVQRFFHLLTTLPRYRETARRSTTVNFRQDPGERTMLLSSARKETVYRRGQ